ncbi:MAG: hypothetical protein O3A00_18760 [Planctomycetota bacterium]|nr:hypothetical protein [Planctomycetota bacterium]
MTNDNWFGCSACVSLGIRVFTPAGKEVAYIETPKLPTNCCFGIGSAMGHHSVPKE